MKVFAGVALAFAVLIASAAASVAPTVHVLPPDGVVEATGPDGASVEYTAWATNPEGTEVPVTCSDSSGGTPETSATRLVVSRLFPLGETTVTCTAGEDTAEEDPVSQSFLVTVSDRTAPSLVVPDPINLGAAPSAAGVPASDSRIQAFLASARATDAVDPAPVIEDNAPDVFPVGTTTVRFSATDRFGNVAAQTSTVTVGSPPPPPPPPPPSPPPPPPPPRVDTAPPGEVTNLVARARAGAVTLSWARPADEDFAHVSISRRRGTNPAVRVYGGADTRFTDRNVRAGRRYTYVVSTHDVTGNRSSGVARTVAVPAASLLLAPANGVRVSTPPVLRWRPAQQATYYNVQLWRAGRKILSAWPARSRLALRSTWRYAGTSYRLSPGRYRWYVWPGYGSRAAARYGRLLGQATFVIAPRG